MIDRVNLSHRTSTLTHVALVIDWTLWNHSMAFQSLHLAGVSRKLPGTKNQSRRLPS